MSNMAISEGVLSKLSQGEPVCGIDGLIPAHALMRLGEARWNRRILSCSQEVPIALHQSQPHSLISLSPACPTRSSTFTLASLVSRQHLLPWFHMTSSHLRFTADGWFTRLAREEKSRHLLHLMQPL